MNNFEDILQYLLSEVEAQPEAQVEDIVAKLADKFELSAEEIAEMNESFQVLDEINAKAIDLEEARKEGKTRNGWLQDQLSDIAAQCGDEAPKMMEEIEKGVKTSLEDTLNAEV